MDTCKDKHISRLQREISFHSFALWVVWLGGSFAIVATLFVFFKTGQFPSNTFWISVQAMVLSIPVAIQRNRLRIRLAEQRRTQSTMPN